MPESVSTKLERSIGQSGRKSKFTWSDKIGCGALIIGWIYAYDMAY